MRSPHPSGPLVRRDVPRRILALATAVVCALTGLVAAAPPARAAAGGVVINEFYGRGGSVGQPYTNKFVELHNATDAAIDLGGTSLQYRSAASTSPASAVAPLHGIVPAHGYFLIQLNSNGSGGLPLPTPDIDASRIAVSGSSGTIWLANTTTAGRPDAADVIDKLGYGSSNSPEGTAVAYPGTNATVGSLNRTDGGDTDDNARDFTFTADLTPQNSGDTSPEPPPAPVPVAIADIQGPGDATPLAGQRVTTTGIVTATYPTGGFAGVYLQTPGTGGAVKAAGTASDGIFVASNAAASDLRIGDCIVVTGTAEESAGLTRLAGAPMFTPAADCDPVTPTPLATLPATDADREAYEGMLVHPEGPYTITNNYALNQYGQLGLAVGTEPLYQATDVVAPGDEAAAHEAANLLKAITLDDGSSWNYLTNATAKGSPLPYVSAATPMRTGSRVTFARPVILDFRHQWNYQPQGQVVGHDAALVPVEATDDREATPPAVGDGLRLASFNVLNYFTDLGQDEAGCAGYLDRDGTPVTARDCQVRGAYTPAAFADQERKLVAAINALDADIVALMEVENSAGLTYISHPRDHTLSRLVAALNAAAGGTRWAFAPSPTVVPTTEDVIRTAFIYNPDAVALDGASLIDIAGDFANARYPLAQRFTAGADEAPFVVIANHFKSKGSGEDDGTGQGLSNPSREAQARELTRWAAEQFGDDPVFLLGDFNAYSRETPVQIIEAAGYVNLAADLDPGSTSYQYSGRLGSLDHAFANAAARQWVTGAAVWDINGDESVAFQYSRRNYNVVDLYAPDPFASSDHDPVLVGFEPATAPFVDVPVGAPFRAEIAWMKQAGLTTGWPDGTFRPLQPVARDAMAAFLHRLAGRPSVAGLTEPFVDVAPGMEHYDAIVWAHHAGITTGWPDGTFRPSEPINRDAMMVFLHRFAGSPDYTPPEESPFSDVAPGDPFYREILWAHAHGITTGYPDGTFRPLAATNRDATAAYFHRFVVVNGFGFHTERE